MVDDAPVAAAQQLQLVAVLLLGEGAHLPGRGAGLNHDLVPDEPAHEDDPAAHDELTQPSGCQEPQGVNARNTAPSVRRMRQARPKYSYPSSTALDPGHSPARPTAKYRPCRGSPTRVITRTPSNRLRRRPPSRPRKRPCQQCSSVPDGARGTRVGAPCRGRYLGIWTLVVKGLLASRGTPRVDVQGGFKRRARGLLQSPHGGPSRAGANLECRRCKVHFFVSEAPAVSCESEWCP